jgi:hypothetical protein
MSASPFELTYCKCKTPKLFESLEHPTIGLRNLQNYIPIYRRFFLLSDSNHNSIGLNQRRHLASIAEVVSKNVVNATLTENADASSSSKVSAFIKHSPLLDPIKYLSGKYDMQAPDLLVLPSYDSHDSYESHDSLAVHQIKKHDVNNSSYVDAFFTYLTSQTLHTHGFVHGLDFYGSFLANQNEFTVNVYDELEYFSTCDFFLKHRNELFRLDGLSELFDADHALSDKPRLNLCDGDTNECLELDDLTDLTELNATATFSDSVDTLPDMNETQLVECTADVPMDLPSPRGKRGMDDSDDSCSSRSSDDNEDNEDNEDNDNRVVSDNSGDSSGDNSGDNSDEDDGSSSNSSSSNSNSNSSNSSNGDDEVHNAHIFNFPVHSIVMEKCDNTLDSLMYGRNELTEAEWSAALMQVIMTLIAYQRMFAFTHNDLHTNNIMYVKTDKKFLHYLYNGVYYRVPTHGRIMKIIDFGRAIFKYRGQTMVSDSFDRTGDAASQYNCEPYLNPKKPRLDPNPSFDLCRLACSLFDYFVEDIRDEAEYAATLKENRVASMVVEWLNDDKGRNVLYKKNGDERYPEFKLYKMIARTVHGAVPHEQLSKPMFAHYAIPRKQINGKPHIMNIDALPSYKDALTPL